VISILVAACVLAGCLSFLAGTVGLLRFPDTLTRLHALTKADNLGLGLVCLGLAIHDGTFAAVLRLFFIWMLAIIAASISAFLVARWSLHASAADGGGGADRVAGHATEPGV
jgi:multicomponent Na+:H+ antiporter subunit G